MRVLRYLQQHPKKLLLVSLFGFGVWFEWASKQSYWMQFYDTIVSVNIVNVLATTLAVVSAVGIMTALALYTWNRSSLKLMGLSVVVGAVLIRLITVSPTPAPLTPLSSLQWDNHVYMVAYSGTSTFSIVHYAYHLYECDSAGIMCHVLYRKLPPDYLYMVGSSIDSGDVNGETKDDTTLWDARLRVDSVTNTVLLELDGEVVYTHQVEGS